MIDMLNLKSVRAFAEEINKTETKVDILVNNAGVSKGSEAKVCPICNMHTIKFLTTNFYLIEITS